MINASRLAMMDSWCTAFLNALINFSICIVSKIELYKLAAVYLTDFSPYVVVLTFGITNLFIPHKFCHFLWCWTNFLGIQVPNGSLP